VDGLLIIQDNKRYISGNPITLTSAQDDGLKHLNMRA
jgi:hypothetical protein